MRRFEYDENEEYQEDVDNFLQDIEGYFVPPDQYESMALQQQQVIHGQLEAVHKDLNQRLLFSVINMLQKSFFWKFKSFNSKLRAISKAYQMFTDLIQVEYEDEDEDEESEE